MGKSSFRKSLMRFGLLISAIIAIMSCTSRKTHSDRENLIPEKDLISILIDIHIADGLLGVPSINSSFSSLDSISAYYQVIEKHGYKKEDMDRTMKYYFIKDEKKLNKIYDRVLGILSEMDSRVERDALLEQLRRSNLWRGKDIYFAPSDESIDSTSFDFKVVKPGYYALNYTVTVYPDDQSYKPAAVIYTMNPDSLQSGNKQFLRSPGYFKDGEPHNYNFLIKVPSEPGKQIRGMLMDPQVWTSDIDGHYRIENISLTYSNLPE